MIKQISILVGIIVVALGIGGSIALAGHNYNNWECYWNCNTPSPSVSPSPSPIDECEDEKCEEPSPTPTPESTETAKVEPSQPSGGSYSPPVCNGVAAEPFKLWGFKVISPTSVEFKWENKQNLDYYSINYGYSENSLVYGVPNIDKSATSITLNGLQVGVPRWAQVTAYRNSCSTLSNKLDP